MKILLTGASSFTGAWFATALRSAGHEVVATLQGAVGAYADARGRRVALLREAGVTLVEQCSFGDARFMGLLEGGVDAVCHHGAQVMNYKSLDFDVLGAVQQNTRNARQVIEAATRGGARAVVVTGSVFEQDEGFGSEPRRAFSPYGLSKGLSWQVFRFWGEQLGHPVHKFVIPNPFGPHEEPRFCAYLMGRWSKGEVAQVGTPAYIRDNIHVSLLAASYREFVERAASSGTALHFGPSGYVESQGQFALRFAREIGMRLGLKAELAFANQTDFVEPEMRVNTDRPSLRALGWEETQAWDELAAYYRLTYLAG
jgi:nucleoside-diphosphate-sugar epimerase